MCWFRPIHVFIHCWQMAAILDDYLVHFCWSLHLGSRFLQTGSSHKCSWVPLSFALWIEAKLLCYCFCLLDSIVKLHAMDEKLLNDFLIGRWEHILYVINAYLNQELHFVHVVKAFITLHWKARYTYISSFSSMLLVRIHLFSLWTSRIEGV